MNVGELYFLEILILANDGFAKADTRNHTENTVIATLSKPINVRVFPNTECIILSF